MRNKIYFKKYLFTTLIISLVLALLLILINYYEYTIYTKNVNSKIAQIIETYQSRYPGISENEIMDILNNPEAASKSFAKYNIDIDKDSLVLINEKYQLKFGLINGVCLILSFLILTMIFISYNKRKDQRIKNLTAYLKAINNNDYSLKLEDYSEDELSILNEEVYKTTVMLKEKALNSKKVQNELKKSLEDISHQLKTPLTSILIILDNLINEPNIPKEQQEEFLRDIKRETMNINFLVQALLKLSKFDANTIEFHNEEYSLTKIVKKAISNLASLCDLKNVKINLKNKTNNTYNCDEFWQTEAITNILKNCIEASLPNGEIDVTIKENNAYFLITIQDYGEGISPPDLPHIFERFYQGQRKSNGVGIGLALAKTITEKNNGNINVYSNAKGTTFEIRYFKI